MDQRFPRAPRLTETVTKVVAFYDPRTWKEKGLWWTLGLFVVTYLVVIVVLGVYWSRSPAGFDVRENALKLVGNDPAKLVPGSLTTATAIGITDHGDLSNIDFIVPRIVAVADQLNKVMSVRVIPGIEITHVPPVLIAEMVVRARSLGARLVLVHGETISEPVAPGTNRAALEADIDVLAHPGLISEEDVVFAGERGIF